MCTIHLKDIVRGQPLPDAGSTLLRIMVSKLNAGENIVLDLDEVPSLPSIFLNTSIGKFIEEKGIALLKERVSFSNISRGQVERLKDYISKFE